MSTPTPAHRIERSELALVAALFLTGIVLRCAYPAHMAVEHFDEGVYASDIWFGPESGNHYPALHLFAPPLLPEAIFWTFVFGGTSNFGAMLPAMVAGCATIVLVWWTARSWFGPAAGLAACTLCALSDPHIAFSRTALTDVVLCFWLLAAVHCLWLASTRGSYLWAVVAGIATGLAWWTKYNGWLPLAIGAAGLGAFWVTAKWWRGGGWRVEGESVGGLQIDAAQRGPRSSAKRIHSLPPPPSTLPPSHPPTSPLPLLATTTLVACAVWSPWLLALQHHGGYAAVAANHRGYLVGWQGWLGSALQQFENLSFLQGTAGAHAVTLASFVVVGYWSWQTGRFTWNRSLTGIVLLGCVAAPAGIFLHFCLAGTGLVATLVLARQIEDQAARTRVVTAGWLLAAWFCGLTLTTPLYAPYPRLVLPWLMSTWLAVGAAVYALKQLILRPAHAPPLQGGVRGGRATEDRSPAAGAAATASGQRESAVRSASGSSPLVRTAESPRSLAVAPSPPADHPSGRVQILVTWLALVAALATNVAFEMFAVPHRIPAWQPRDGLVSIAAKMFANAQHSAAGQSTPTDIVIYTYGEPALLFQLRLAGVENVLPVASLPGIEQASTPPVAVFVAVGEQARRTAGFAEQLETARSRLDLVASYDYAPSDIVLLDNRDPRDRPPANRKDARPTYAIELYRVR